MWNKWLPPLLYLLIIVGLAASYGCGGADDAKPNANLKVPEIKPGRGVTGKDGTTTLPSKKRKKPTR